MQPTAAHDFHNAELLRFIPGDARKIVEIGSSTGALAREYKKFNANCHYVGVELSLDYVELSRRHCDAVVHLDIECADEGTFRDISSGADCWVLGDSLEHLKDPWTLLRRLRQYMPKDGCVAACIPNAQHWSVQARLNRGTIYYEPSGLLDQTHLRWFTRITLFDLFQKSGFQIGAVCPRIFDHPERERVLRGIWHFAESIGADPNQALQDALPTQYVVRAVPG